MTGPTSVSSSQPTPSRSFSASPDEPRRELVVDALLRDHAARRGAALAGGAERRPEDPLDGEVEVGVVEDDDRVLAAELEVDVLEAVGRVLRDLDARLARAGERDHGHVGVRDDRVADLSPPPWTMLTTPAGTPASIRSSTKRSPSVGRVRRRLEDDRVPADERGQDLPRRDRDREVPRRDHADDADRLRTLMLNLSGSSDGRRLAEQAPALAAHVVGHVDRFLDVAARPRRSTLPISRAISWARSSFCSVRSCAKRKRISPRFGAGTRRQSS